MTNNVCINDKLNGEMRQKLNYLTIRVRKLLNIP